MGRQIYSTSTGINAPAKSENPGWKLERYILEKFEVDPATGLRTSDTPYEVREGETNMLLYGGAGAMWQLFIGGSITPYDNANAYLGVGDSTTESDRTMTDLQAATNKTYIGQDLGYPLHADGTDLSAANITYRATFATGDANYDWNEWGLFNASAGGRMANRKVEALGTKTVASEWTLTIVISLS